MFPSKNEDFQNHPSSSSSTPHLHDMSMDETTSSSDGKRRLRPDQVKALERSFELSTRLEPERKVQLARDLGLQPRQVAIWFQNRRARWKTKKLEKEYDALKRHLHSLQAYNDALKSHNNKLHSQLVALRGRDAVGFLSDGQGVFPSSSSGMGAAAPAPAQDLEAEPFSNVFGEGHQGIWPCWPDQQSFN